MVKNDGIASTTNDFAGAQRTPIERRIPESQAQIEQTEPGDHEDRTPLGAAGQSEADARGDAPRAQQEAAYRPERADIGGCRLVALGQLGASPVAVGDEAMHGTQQPERQEAVQQGDPGHHEVQPVQRKQRSGDAAEQGRTGEPPDEPAHHAAPSRCR